jgi:VanZ family protein
MATLLALGGRSRQCNGRPRFDAGSRSRECTRPPDPLGLALGTGLRRHDLGLLLTPLLRWLWPEIGHETLRSAHFFVRKCAHLTEYALLGLLAARALWLTLDISPLRVAVLTLLLVAAVSGVDEARQSFLPTRTGSLADVAIDFVGGAVGVLLIIAFHRWLGVGTPAPRAGEGA